MIIPRYLLEKVVGMICEREQPTYDIPAQMMRFLIDELGNKDQEHAALRAELHDLYEAQRVHRKVRSAFRPGSIKRGHSLVSVALLFSMLALVGLAAYYLICPAVKQIGGNAPISTSIEEVPVVGNITIQDVKAAIEIIPYAILGGHFNSPKHSKDKPPPEEILTMISATACRPIRVYECIDWNYRIKFVCNVTPAVEVGLVIALDDDSGIPLVVNAFPAPTPYWTTLGTAGCNLLGEY